MIYNYKFLLLLFWLLSICIYTFNFIHNFHFVNNILLIVSTISYLVYFYKPSVSISISSILTLFIFLKVFILLLSLVDNDLYTYFMYNGDAYRYHYPRIEQLNLSNWFEYITDYKMYAVETGKLTHLFYALFYNLFNPILEILSDDKIYNLHIISYIINTLLLITVVIYIYKVLSKNKIEKIYIIYSVSLILFSPFIITWSNYLMKETIYICVLLISIIAILEKKYIILILISIFFLVDRLYMLYFFGLLFLLSNRINKKYLFILSIAIVSSFVLLFPIEKYVNSLVYIIDYADNKAIGGSTVIMADGYLVKIVRIFFSPFIFSAYKDDYIASNIFFREHLTVGLLTTYFLVRLFSSKWSRFTVLICCILIFNLMLFPYSARQKITVLIPLLSIVYPLFLHCKKHKININQFWKI